MHITIVGTGYVGLVSGACFAEFGFEVTCVDQDKAKINQLIKGEIPFYEPGLESVVWQTRKNKRLHFSTDLKESVKSADIVFIAVGTPSRRGDGHADLSYVFQAAKQIGEALEDYTVVVTKSTVPVGTCRKVAEVIRETKPKAEFDVASNPEFLREGSAINDFMRPDRIIVGAETEKAKAHFQKLYRPLYLTETPIVFTNIETAELIKYAANSFLATKIAFINEIADICEKVGADVQEVAKGIGLDGRIGRKFLHAGPGFGGSCFPKDVLALIRTAQEIEAPISIVESVFASNERRKKAMATKVIKILGGSVAGKTIAVLGVTFKPNTDDMREACSLTLIPELQQHGAIVRSYDPVGRPVAESLLPQVHWSNNPYEAAQGADALVLLTEWNEFRALDFERLKSLMLAPIFIDLRNVYKPEEISAAGFDYHSIGRSVSQRKVNSIKTVAVA